MAEKVDHRPDIRLLVSFSGVLLVACGGLWWWTETVRARLPDPVARHWGVSGVADGFSSLTQTVVLSIGIVLGVTLPMALVAVFSRQPVALRRTLAGMAAFLVGFMTILTFDSLRGQLDLSDPSLAPLPGPGILLGIIGGVLVGAAAAALVRRPRDGAKAKEPPPASAPRLDDADSDLVWQAKPAGFDKAAEVLGILAGLGLGLLSALISWWLLPIAIVIVALILGAGRISTTIDRAGLHARVLGMRILHIPLDEVAEADVTEVDPFWEFGGWGLRVDTAGRVGLVTRKGPAVRIRRGDGSEVLITVDEADRAAATLNTLADRVS